MLKAIKEFNKIASTKKTCNAYPAGDDDRIMVIGQKDSPVSNFGTKVDVVIEGKFRLKDNRVVNGTSISAAFVTGTILRLIK